MAYWDRLAFPYDLLRPRLRRMDVEILYLHETLEDTADDARARDERLRRDRRWLEEQDVDVVLLPSWVEHHFMREGPEDVSVRLYRLLAGRSTDFRLAREVRSRFFTEGWYVWGDPMLETHWETATAGYKLFVRADSRS